MFLPDHQQYFFALIRMARWLHTLIFGEDYTSEGLKSKNLSFPFQSYFPYWKAIRGSDSETPKEGPNLLDTPRARFWGAQ